MRLLLTIALLGALSFAITTAHATETRVTIRVLAHDAKLIGNVAGLCAITIRDAATSRILAEGIQTGGTENTDKIIREPWIRGQERLNTEGAAAFTTTLDLDRPTRVIVEARGPLGFRARVLELRVNAADDSTSNFGSDSVVFRLSR